MDDARYRPRIIDGPLRAALATDPAVLLQGPRAVGKSTTARRYAASTVSLDNPTEAEPFRADPDRALARRQRPLLIDEWQFVPDVMWAVKRAVDSGALPGSFILAGSVNTTSINGQPVFGRTKQLTMWPATYAESHQQLPTSPADPLRALLTAPLTAVIPALTELTIDDYLQAIVIGGYPRIAFEDPPRPDRARDLLTDITTSDASELSPRANIGKFALWLQANALQTAQAPATATLLDQTGINRKTADRYDQLLQEMYVLELVPPFFDNRLKRLRKTPKRYLTDTGLACAGLNVTAEALSAEPALAGHLLDTYVAAQLRALLPSMSPRLTMQHLRNDSGLECDIVLTDPTHTIGLEVTATPNPDSRRTKSDAKKTRNLRAMRDQLGEKFTRGILLHTGPDTYLLDRNILAAPISSLWNAG
ncbi:MAG: DUF4143 domain-containing protein [Actinomycetes bacterium]